MITIELARVLAAIRELLDAHGQASKAAWLADREQALEAAESPETAKLTIAELHSIVLGMGGLFDLPLAAASKEATESARTRLDELADQLFEMTRNT
ncbi:hypothetical protein GCM10023346_04380 [Arthrobacter gyeryongensis]|uniref:HPt domain-containing protein n=1 Tax=Arthrobacter gyeryongensis TaxID=1650592 RepID=A0ABP9S1Z6_9MICC